MAYTYHVDDWLIIRTDDAGHDAVVNTELWPEWGPVGTVAYCPPDVVKAAEARVIARAIARDYWPHGCHDGYCGLCEAPDV